MNRQDQQSGGNPPASIEARLAKPMILYGIVAILLACFAFQCVSGMLRHSATFDEHVYIAAGYSYFQTHDFRLKKDAPPLVATLAYFAVRVLETFTHPLKFSILNKYWDLGDVFNEYKFASYFICNDNSNGYAILQSARTPIVLLGVLLGIFVFLRARALFGPLGGLAALFIYCFDPNIIAHSTIVSCDLPLACFYFIAIYYFHRAIQMPGYGNVAAFALFASLTLCSKASGLLLLPSALLLFILVFSFPASDVLAHLGGNANQYRLFLLKQAGFGIVGMALATYILLGFLYHTFSPVLMYINSIRLVYDNMGKEYQYYLFGEFRHKTWWYYYIVCMLLKTPVPALIFFVYAIGLGVRTNGRTLLLVLIPFLFVHLVCSQDQTNLGLRRVLLTYPFMHLLAGSVPPALLAGAGTRSGRAFRVRVGVLGALLLGILLSAILIHPNQLSYFNLLGGGPANGYRYLTDSNLDWGQDLPALKRYMDRHGIEKVAMFYFGTDDPRIYKIRSRPVLTDEVNHPIHEFYVFSIHNLVYQQFLAAQEKNPRLNWLKRFKPTDRIAYSMLVFDFRAPDSIVEDPEWVAENASGAK